LRIKEIIDSLILTGHLVRLSTFRTPTHHALSLSQKTLHKTIIILHLIGETATSPRDAPPGNTICVAPKGKGGRRRIKTYLQTIVDTLIKPTIMIISFITSTAVLSSGNCGTHLRLSTRLTLHLIFRSMKLFTVHASVSN
jgi:hypothetical protein